MDMSPEAIRWIIQALIILVLSICVHEFGHAIVADKLGDGTPRGQGRVTLNPVAHADPIGTLVFPLVALIVTKGSSMGFGWGKPVMVAPINFTRRFQMRTSHMLVAIAGPLMNVLLGVLIIITHTILIKTGVLGHPTVVDGIPTNISAALMYAGMLNFLLFFFNLIPTPPLDGGAVVAGLLPKRYLDTYEEISKYGIFVLIAVIMIPGAARIFTEPAQWVYFNLARLFGLM
jgi:Zn-dependent protease